MAKGNKTITTDNPDMEIRKGVDGVFRVWRKMTFLDLGWITQEEVDYDLPNPIQWVTVGAFNSIKDAKEFSERV